MNFSLVHIKYFLALVQERHFARAAERCFVSQPTLSAAIKKLELHLDVQLFERGHRQEVRLTPAGESLVAQAQKVIDNAELFQQLSQNQQDQFLQPFRLGVIYSVAPYLLPALVPQLKKQAPDMALLIEENYTHELRKQLIQGDIDAAIVALPFDEPGIQTQILYWEPFCVVAPAGHALTKQTDKISKDEIMAEELLLLGPGHCLRDQVLEACPHCVGNTEVNEMFRGSSLETIVNMVASGAGVSILPERCARQHQHNLLVEILPLEKPVPYREVVLAWRNSTPKQDVINLFQKLAY